MEENTAKQESKIKKYLHRYFIDAMSAMAQGLFASLLIGTIISTLGTQLGIPVLDEIGGYAKSAAGPAMAVAIGYALQAPPLVLFSLVAVGGADQLFVQNQAGETLGLLNLSGVYGSETHVTVTFTKEQYGNGLKFIFYLYCVGDNQACKEGHGDEWLRIDTISFMKNEQLQSGPLCDVSDEIGYLAPQA